MGHGDPSTGQEQGQVFGTSTTFLSVKNSFFPKVLRRSLYKKPYLCKCPSGERTGAKALVRTGGNCLQMRRSKV